MHDKNRKPYLLPEHCSDRSPSLYGTETIVHSTLHSLTKITSANPMATHLNMSGTYNQRRRKLFSTGGALYIIRTQFLWRKLDFYGVKPKQGGTSLNWGAPAQPPWFLRLCIQHLLYLLNVQGTKS